MQYQMKIVKSRTAKEKLSLIEGILEEGKVLNRFKPTMRITLLKLSHKDISNLALGFIVYNNK